MDAPLNRLQRLFGIAPAAREFFLSRWVLLAGLVLFVFLFSVLATLYRDGKEVFLAQKDALVLEVFSQTDLAPEGYTLLEEQLRAAPHVREVMAISPQESLKDLAGDPKISLDTEWLFEKSDELQGKNTILPWTYRLYLSKWDESALKETSQTIEGLEVGTPKRKAVSEVHYDKERWSLAFALYNYVRWLSAVLATSLIFLFAFLAVFFVKWLRWARDVGRNPELPGAWVDKAALWREIWSVMVFGAACGLLAHCLYLGILSFSFFSDTFSWRHQAGQFLPVQVAMSAFVTLLVFFYFAIDERE